MITLNGIPLRDFIYHARNRKTYLTYYKRLSKKEGQIMPLRQEKNKSPRYLGKRRSTP